MQLLRWVIRPVLTDIRNHSADAEKLVLGTACQESECGRWLVQLQGGPARGIYQSERPAMMDNLVFIDKRPFFKNHCKKWISSRQPWLVDDIMSEIVWNLAAATLMCRVHYLRFPEPIPDNLPAQAEYYKRYYNTEQGKGTPDDYIRNWHRFIGNNLLV
jgi:hypothetical protein